MLKKFEKVNKKVVNPEVYEEFKKTCYSILNTDMKRKKYTVLDLFKYSRLGCTTVILIIYW